jgi:hypothetical protein
MEGHPCGRIPERVLPNLGEILERCLPGWLLSWVHLRRIRQKMRKKEKKHLRGRRQWMRCQKIYFWNLKRYKFICPLSKRESYPSSAFDLSLPHHTL